MHLLPDVQARELPLPAEQWRMHGVEQLVTPKRGSRHPERNYRHSTLIKLTIRLQNTQAS